MTCSDNLIRCQFNPNKRDEGKCGKKPRLNVLPVADNVDVLICILESNRACTIQAGTVG